MTWASNLPVQGGDYDNKTPVNTTVFNNSFTIAGMATFDLLTYTGRGFITEIRLNYTGGANAGIVGIEVVVDSNRTITFYNAVGSTAFFPSDTGFDSLNFVSSSATAGYGSFRYFAPIPFKRTLTVRLKNNHGSNVASGNIAYSISALVS